MLAWFFNGNVHTSLKTHCNKKGKQLRSQRVSQSPFRKPPLPQDYTQILCLSCTHHGNRNMVTMVIRYTNCRVRMTRDRSYYQVTEYWAREYWENTRTKEKSYIYFLSCLVKKNYHRPLWTLKAIGYRMHVVISIDCSAGELCHNAVTCHPCASCV